MKKLATFSDGTALHQGDLVRFKEQPDQPAIVTAKFRRQGEDEDRISLIWPHDGHESTVLVSRLSRLELA